MSFRTIVVVACSIACCLLVPATSQCTPDTEKQIAQTMNTWVKDWNEKRMDDLMKLYNPHAVLLPADGSRASDKAEIRAYLEKQIGTKMELNSPGPAYGCGGKDVPCLAFETGTYKQSGTGKTIEGQYLVVLLYLPKLPGSANMGNHTTGFDGETAIPNSLAQSRRRNPLTVVSSDSTFRPTVNQDFSPSVCRPCHGC